MVAQWSIETGWAKGIYGIFDTEDMIRRSERQREEGRFDVDAKVNNCGKYLVEFPERLT